MHYSKHIYIYIYYFYYYYYYYTHSNPHTHHYLIYVPYSYSNTLPGVISQKQLQQVKSMKPFHGRVISIGVSQYCGYMIRSNIMPLSSTGFQIRISTDDEQQSAQDAQNNQNNLNNQNNRNNRSQTQSLHDQVHQNRNKTNNEINTRKYDKTDKSDHENMDSDKTDPFVLFEKGSIKLYNSCKSLGGEMHKSLNDDFSSRFIKYV